MLCSDEILAHEDAYDAIRPFVCDWVEALRRSGPGTIDLKLDDLHSLLDTVAARVAATDAIEPDRLNGGPLPGVTFSTPYRTSFVLTAIDTMKKVVGL